MCCLLFRQYVVFCFTPSPQVIGCWDFHSTYLAYNFLAGKIVKDSQYFQDNNSIWPEGYTALRKFTSIAGGTSWRNIIYLCFEHEIFLTRFLWHIYLWRHYCHIITLFHYSWTFGVSDLSAFAIYKMEVSRDAESQIRPLFRVTLDTGEQVSLMVMHSLFSFTDVHCPAAFV